MPPRVQSPEVTGSRPALRPLREDVETNPSSSSSRRRRTGASPVSAFSGDQPAQRSTVETTPLWNQADPRWGSRTLGRRAKLRSSGCAMTATAMAASQISGRHLDPSQLDQQLDRSGGYSGDALNWDVAARQFGLTQRAVSFNSRSGRAEIDRQLDSGRPVVIGVDYKQGSRGGANGTDHWITLTGRGRNDQGQTVYYANDPAGGRRITLVEQNGRLVEQNAPARRRPYVSSGPAHVFVGGQNGTPAQAGITSTSNASVAEGGGRAQLTAGATPQEGGGRANLDAPAAGGRYTIQRGDTLSELAQRFGVSVHALARANHIRDPNRIYAGNELVIPGRSTPVTAGAEPTPEPLNVQGGMAARVGGGTPDEVAPVTSGTTTNGRALDLQRELSDPNSTLSVAIGHAEGNRTVSGGFTASYNGHSDPGNRAHNLGTFSYQVRQNRNVRTAAQADAEQLRRLRGQIPAYEAAARRAGLDPSNPRLQAAYFDLWNQSPNMAARFLRRLPQTLAGRPLTVETLTDARHNACFDDRGRFTSTGLKSPTRARADQLRRERALEAVLQQRGVV